MELLLDAAAVHRFPSCCALQGFRILDGSAQSVILSGELRLGIATVDMGKA